MESRLDRVLRLKNQVEELRSEVDKARGACEEVTKRLQKERNCQNLTQAKKTLQRLLRENRTRGWKIDKMTQELEKELGAHEDGL